MNRASSGSHTLHLGIAEAGKVHALGSRHVVALVHYREALRLAVAAGAPEVFFRHYTQCALESLELMASYPEVIHFCEEADAYYRQSGTTHGVQRRDHAAILERLGFVRLKAGQVARGTDALREAVQLAGRGALPASEEVLVWLGRRLTVDVARITRCQRRHRYFTVRADQVDRARARPLPSAVPAEPAALTG